MRMTILTTDSKFKVFYTFHVDRTINSESLWLWLWFLIAELILRSAVELTPCYKTTQNLKLMIYARNQRKYKTKRNLVMHKMKAAIDWYQTVNYYILFIQCWKLNHFDHVIASVHVTSHTTVCSFQVNWMHKWNVTEEYPFSLFIKKKYMYYFRMGTKRIWKINAGPHEMS